MASRRRSKAINSRITLTVFEAIDGTRDWSVAKEGQDWINMIEEATLNSYIL